MKKGKSKKKRIDIIYDGFMCGKFHFKFNNGIIFTLFEHKPFSFLKKLNPGKRITLTMEYEEINENK